jgi:hypothetical protein
MAHNIRKVVTVHESTVKAVAKGQHVKKKTPKKGSKNSRVVTVQALDPMLVKWMKHNNVSLRDIATVVSPTQIILK